MLRSLAPPALISQTSSRAASFEIREGRGGRVEEPASDDDSWGAHLVLDDVLLR